MMMQMLEAGGVPILSDGIRKADEDNPRGYYEYEPVKKVREDTSWIEGAMGKAVKMVYALLPDLPDTHRYRVIFMRRDMNEVIASQNRMLARHGQATETDETNIVRMFQRQVEKVRSVVEARENFEVLYVEFKELLREAEPIVRRIDEFLGGGLDLDSMGGVIDPALYRNRSGR